jgi:hypothetical protein
MRQHHKIFGLHGIVSSTGLPVRRRIVERLSGDSAVEVCLDGVRAAVSFRPDGAEHRRRMDADVSAVTSLALLHALWLLPAGFPVPPSDIPPAKAKLLLEAPQHVDLVKGSFVRRYQAAGKVDVVGLTGRHGDKVIARAIRCSPIFRRLALLGPTTSEPSRASLAAAREWGIGVISVAEDELEVVVAAAPGVLGIPSVYRWWVSELAYSSYASAQADN